jgi:hypothetical protein
MAEELETDVWKEIRGVLKAGLLAGTIPEEPKEMAYDEAFVRRFKSVQDDHQKKVLRCEEDLSAYTVSKMNHPTPSLTVAWI